MPTPKNEFDSNKLPQNIAPEINSSPSEAPLSVEIGVPQQTEGQIAPETNIEQLEKRPMEIKEDKGGLAETVKNLSEKLGLSKKKPTIIPQVRDDLMIKVETILEEGLKEAFQELTPVQRQEFKIKGEETAFQVRDLLKATHVKVKSIFRLILEWLKMLPGINRFFLEQEAKIKADKILSLKELDHHD